MLTYDDLTIYFGTPLKDEAFQKFLAANFPDLTAYDIFNGYITSSQTTIELGFENSTAVFDEDTEEVFDEGDPVFSHINLYPGAACIINQLPFEISFSDTRKKVQQKTETPVQTKMGFNEILDTHFINDSYKIGDVAITVEYDAAAENITLIQIRDNNALEYLKL